MTASTNQPHGAKCRRPILVALIAVSAMSFMVYARPDKEKLLANVNECLRGKEDFGQLYDGASDTVRRNVSRDKFVRRMNIAAAKLREIDGGLHFERDSLIEEVISGGGSDIISTAQTLEHDGKSVSILIHWDKKGRFFDMSVLPKPGTPEGYAVYGISYNQLRVGNRILDY